MKKILLTLLAAFTVTAHAADITGAGATFPYPIYSKWAEGYKKTTGVGLNYQSIGSSGGVRQINAKTVAFGATDAPVSGADLDKNGQVQFPAVLGGVVPVFNLEGFKPGELRLNGVVLAEIFMGKITKWNDPMPDPPEQHKGRTIAFFLVQLCCHLSRHRGQLNYIRRILEAGSYE